MIRFCDKEVYCIKENEMDRSQLIFYFLNGHRDDMLCIVDDFGRFQGKITYPSLIQSDDVKGSIQTEKVILDEQIWQNGRTFFKFYKKFGNEIVLLPVINQDGQLLCFAYQDEEANREIRQLRELTECEGALGFCDIFPQYDCVTIWECNELAYYFAKYLSGLGVAVKVKGNFWEEICNYLCGESINEGLDYRNLNIYAEGTWEKCADLRQYLLRSVSAEFECINVVYEKNVEVGLIKDTLYEFKDLIQKLKQGDYSIVINGIENESLAACNLFLKNNIKDVYFLSNEGKQGKRLIGGKPVVNPAYAYQLFNNAVFIDCCMEHSVCGADLLNNADYFGYRRNERYFCLKDYINIGKSDLKYLFQGQHIVLVGDFLLCKKFYIEYAKMLGNEDMVYFDIIGNEVANLYNDIIPAVNKSDLNKGNLFLIFAPEYIYSNKKIRDRYHDNIEYKRCIEYLKQEEYYNYIKMQWEIPDSHIDCKIKYTDNKFKPKGIMIGSLLGDCGNYLMREILNGQYQIIKMDYGLLNQNLILFCVRLAGERSCDILKIFWILVKAALDEEGIRKEFGDVQSFNEKMQEMLKLINRPTSQELFVILHLASAAMNGVNINDVSRYVIYWETHGVQRTIHEDCTKWLWEKDLQGVVLTNSRNCIVRVGGLLRYFKTLDYFIRTDSVLFRMVLESPKEWEAENSAWDDIEIKFEDLKCRPFDVVTKIGDKLNLSFQDVLHGTIYGSQVNYADIERIMKPVYNTYDEFLSTFDKMRIALLMANWQQKRNYPFENIKDFTRKELQEMFSREFRFEKEIKFSSDEEYLIYREGRQKWLRQRLYNLRIDYSKF